MVLGVSLGGLSDSAQGLLQDAERIAVSSSARAGPAGYFLGCGGSPSIPRRHPTRGTGPQKSRLKESDPRPFAPGGVPPCHALDSIPPQKRGVFQNVLSGQKKQDRSHIPRRAMGISSITDLPGVHGQVQEIPGPSSLNHADQNGVQLQFLNPASSAARIPASVSQPSPPGQWPAKAAGRRVSG